MAGGDFAGVQVQTDSSSSPASAFKNGARPSCPAEQLSCGLQRPVVSDGVRPFRNDDMGLQATFPAGSRVCLARSGDAPRGFYAWYGSNRTDCPERGDIPAAYISISSAFNAMFRHSLRESAGDCQALSQSLARKLREQPLEIPGHQSMVCQQDASGNRIELLVYAMAGQQRDDASDVSPAVIYWASLGTTPDRWAHDIRVFRAFLHTVQIGTGYWAGRSVGIE
jgi:hypothetical protein